MARVLMIATDWDVGNRNGKTGAVTHYRLSLPKKYLEKQGHTVDLYGKDFHNVVTKGETIKTLDDANRLYEEMFSNYDVIISKVIDNAIAAGCVVRAAKETKTPLLVDLDDNFLEVRSNQPAYRQGYAPGGRKRAVAASYVSMAEGIITSTQPLANYFQAFNKTQFDQDSRVFVCPNSFDLTEWKRQTETAKTIAWFGSITHVDDLKVALPALIEFGRRHKDYIFEFIGGFEAKAFKKIQADIPSWFMKRCNFMRGTNGYQGFTEMVYHRTWALGIAPLVDDEFNRAKSHIKWAEYALAGVPCVASNVYPYQVIEHGKTGWLSEPQNWLETLETAIASEIPIAANAKAYIKENLSIEVSGKLWEKAIHDII